MKIFIQIFLLITPTLLRGQDVEQLSLPQVIDMAKNQSISARQAATTKETKYWEYRNFQSNYKPQLLLTSRLPAYVRTFSEVVQPDGTVQFKPVRNNNSSVGLSLEQNISRTGGTIYAATQMQRFDDFDRKNTLFNGTLFAVGISQPLFRFNPFKWEKKIEPLKYSESQQEYIESLEQIAMRANEFFFDLLLAQVNLGISETNLKNTTDILRIANEKFDIGKNSRNEILQLQLEQLKAQKAVATAKRDLEISTLNLKAFIGLQGAEKLGLTTPLEITPLSISAEKATSEAFLNRANAIGFTRRLLEAERNVAKAKGDNGLNAMLTANLGFSNSGQKVSDLYQRPQNQQLITIEFSMPVLDWGRAESRLKTAQANQKLVQYTIEQDKQNLKQEIYTQVTLFDMLKDQLVLTEKADSIASEKYIIAKDRYVLGNLSITDLSIAFAERDQAKRDFIGVLRDYWAAFYRLRWLSLYDFEKGERIK